MAHRNAWQPLLLSAALVFAAPATGHAQEAAASSDSLASQVERLGRRIEGLSGQLVTLASDTDRLKRFKLSGYVQARWETGEAKADTVAVDPARSPAALTAANNERFAIRRGRLKLTYDASPTSQAVVYFDGNTSGSSRNVTLLEAYVALTDPWTKAHDHQLSIGQMNVPFGFELERSSSARELPERSRAENVLFAGERDRGVKWVARWRPWLETTLGAWNGGGIHDADFPTTDPSRRKDWSGRARVRLGVADLAASIYEGEAVLPLTGAEVQLARDRVGFDAQTRWKLARLGEGALYAEWYGGRQPNASRIASGVLDTTLAPGVVRRTLRPGVSAGSLSPDITGGYVMWVQHAGERLQAAVRWDRYDPDTDADHDAFSRVSLALNAFWDAHTRVTLAYDLPETERLVGGSWRDPADNLWTVQVQHRF